MPSFTVAMQSFLPLQFEAFDVNLTFTLTFISFTFWGGDNIDNIAFICPYLSSILIYNLFMGAMASNKGLFNFATDLPNIRNTVQSTLQLTSIKIAG